MTLPKELLEKAEAQAETESFKIEDCCGTSDIYIAAEKSFIAGAEWMYETMDKPVIECKQCGDILYPLKEVKRILELEAKLAAAEAVIKTIQFYLGV